MNQTDPYNIVDLMGDDASPRFLLLRTDRIGDVVLTTPAVTVLRQAFPHAIISFLAKKYTKPLLESHPGIDEVLIYEPEGRHRGVQGHRRLAKSLRKRRFDAAIFFYPRPWLAFTVWWAGIPLRIGYGYRWYSGLFNRRVFEHRKKGHKHELDHNLTLIEPLVLNLPAEVAFNLRLTPHHQHRLETLVKKYEIATPYLIIHPGNGGSAPNLRVEQYRFITRYLLENTPLPILFTGTAGEAALIKAILEPLDDPRLINLAGKLDIGVLMTLIAHARLFIATSTGPLHIADAFGVPALSFYCPAAPCAPRRWGPYRQQTWVLTPEVTPCRHCQPDRCHNGNCLAKISEKKIAEMLGRRLQAIDQSLAVNAVTGAK